MFLPEKCKNSIAPRFPTIIESGTQHLSNAGRLEPKIDANKMRSILACQNLVYFTGKELLSL